MASNVLSVYSTKANSWISTIQYTYLYKIYIAYEYIHHYLQNTEIQTYYQCSHSSVYKIASNPSIL